MEKLLELLRRQQVEIASLQESWDTYQSQMMAFQDNLEEITSAFTADSFEPETHEADCECDLCYEKERADLDELLSKYE